MNTLKRLTVEELKEEILNSCKELAQGKLFSALPIVDATKRLLELEKEAELKKVKQKPKKAAEILDDEF